MVMITAEVTRLLVTAVITVVAYMTTVRPLTRRVLGVGD